MFEKEAEEYANEYGQDAFTQFNMPQWIKPIRMERKLGFHKGAIFGYNKANEWHYVKDGDLPTKELEEKQLLVRVRNYTEDFILAYYMLDKYYSPHGKRFYCDTECDSPINIKNVIAWKEIVPPELPKDSE